MRVQRRLTFDMRSNTEGVRRGFHEFVTNDVESMVLKRMLFVIVLESKHWWPLKRLQVLSNIVFPKI